MNLVGGRPQHLGAAVGSQRLAHAVERLKAAITEAKVGEALISPLVKDGEYYKTVSVAYGGGLRYPKLERIEGVEDWLTQMLSPRP